MLKLLQYAWKHAKKQLITQSLLTLFLSFAEGAGLLFILPLLSLTPLMPSPETGILAKLSQTLSSIGVHSLSLTTVLILYAVSICGIACLKLCQKQGNARLQFGLEKQLRAELYNALISANYQQLKTYNISELSAQLTQQISRFSYAFGQLISVTTTILLVVLYLGMMAMVSLSVLMVILGVVGLSALLLYPFQKRIKAGGVESQKLMMAFQQTVIHDVSTLKQVKAMAKETEAQARFSTHIDDIYTNEMRHTLVNSSSQWVYEMVGVLSLCSIVGITHFYLKLPLDGLILVLVFCARLIPRVGRVFDQMHRITHCLPSFFGVLTLISETSLAHEAQNTESETIPFSSEITLKEATFFQGDRKILESVSVQIKKGEWIGIMGESGAGKTTLIDGLSGLALPQEGTLNVDSVTITDQNARAWRPHIGYMDQTPLLYNGSIRDNLSWGSLTAPSEDAIWTALKQVNAAQFVQSLPNGLETELKDFGQNLSGGERQRLCLARLLIRGSSILIFDEALTHLDAASQTQFKDTIAQLKGLATIIMISHDPADLTGADRIWRVKEGSVLV